MGFLKTLWVNRALPRLDATQLNRIEQGIADAHSGKTNVQSGAQLPAGPADGDMFDLVVDAAGNFGGPVMWRFKWYATLAKWMFIGGGALYMGELSPNVSVQQVLRVIDPGAPKMTSPIAGELEFSMSAEGLCTAAGYIYIGLIINGGGVGGTGYQPVATNNYASVAYLQRVLAVRNDTIYQAFRCGAGSWTPEGISWRVLPRWATG